MAQPDRVARRRWFALLALCLCITVIGVDNTILNVALPTLVRDLHATTSDLQWIVDSYVLVFAGLLLTAGSLGDRFGRKGALMIGLVLFAVASTSAAFSDGVTQLVVLRAFMGIGAAFIMPATLSIITNIFTDPKERGRAIGIWAGVSGIGIGLGPIIGGVLLAHFWWGSIFLVNVPIVCVALTLCGTLVPTSRDPSTPRLDPVGALLSMVGLSLLLWTIIQAPDRGLDQHRHHRGVRRLDRGHRRVRVLGDASRPADARHHVLPQPALHRRQRRGDDGVLRDRRARCSS